MTENTQELNAASNNDKDMILQQGFFHSGPLPHPSVLAQYEKIVPGAADRIIKMAEKQSEHRIEMENKVIHSNIKKSEKGLWFGFIIGLVTIISALVIGVFGESTASYILSGVIGIGGLSSLVSVFVLGKREARKEREDRRKEANL